MICEIIGQKNIKATIRVHKMKENAVCNRFILVFMVPFTFCLSFITQKIKGLNVFDYSDTCLPLFLNWSHENIFYNRMATTTKQ